MKQLNKFKKVSLLEMDKWHDYAYQLKALNLVDKNYIKGAIISLFEKILYRISEKHFIYIQFKIKTVSDVYRSISYLQTIKKNEYMDLIDVFSTFWDKKSDEYHLLEVSHIIFTYKIIPLDSQLISSKITEYDNDLNTKEIKTIKSFGFVLPATMDYTKWGEVSFETETVAVVQKAKSKEMYFIKIFEKHLEAELKVENRIIIAFKDTLKDKDNLNTFVRELKNQTYHIVDGQLKLKIMKKQTKFLTSVKRTPFLASNFITMDLETRTIDGEMTPYCISIVEGKSSISFYLSDYNNIDEMLRNSIKYLMRSKYNKYRVYFHNFSYFDGVFLIDIISSLTNDTLNPVIRDGRIVDFQFKFGTAKIKYTLYFRDSYLLIPSSLKSLAKNFDVENKGIFPYEFVNNPKISLEYEGIIPEYKLFNNITLEEYINYSKEFINKKWKLKDETIKYCVQDASILYQIINKFSLRVFETFRIDIHKYPTLPSLAFAIYRANFIKDFKIPLINGEIYNNIRKGFTGGSVDVFKPYGENIYRYDVNSLYPFVMRESPMPVGSPSYFEGDIYINENKPFGIFEVEITTPENLNIPILQLRFKTDSGLKTISPLGKWTGWYLSSEIYNSLKYGYNIKIIRGYTFEKDYIFKDYIDILYGIKANSNKGSADYVIAKMLMNSLFGRFGMDPKMEKHKIISSKETENIQKKKKNIITNVINLEKSGKELISFFDGNIPENNKSLVNVSIPIATAVTAYARIFMSKFKNSKDFTLFYSDTDSIDIDRPLDHKFIGKELGKFKLEYIFEKGIFLLPKVYAGKISSNIEVVKVKGLKKTISFKELSTLLVKNNKLKITQKKWYRNISKSKIKVKDEIYTLMISSSKRKFIYDDNNNFINTSPFIINNKTIEE